MTTRSGSLSANVVDIAGRRVREAEVAWTDGVITSVPIGSHTPEEIAVSIAARLVAVRGGVIVGPGAQRCAPQSGGGVAGVGHRL